MGEVRTSFRRTTSRISRYSRTLSNSSTGRSDRPYEDIQVAEDKKLCDGDQIQDVTTREQSTIYSDVLQLLGGTLIQWAQVDKGGSLMSQTEIGTWLDTAAVGFGRPRPRWFCFPPAFATLV